MKELASNMKKKHPCAKCKQKGLFLAMDMQTHPLPLFSFDPVFMDDAECAEYNEKRNKFLFQFLFFESYHEKLIEN